MPSESARMNSAAEAAFRVQAPNSRPRVVKVVALDRTGEDVLDRLRPARWSQATFESSAGFVATLQEKVAGADLVVLVAGPGGHAGDAAAIGRVCSDRRVMTTALLVGTGSASDAEVSKTLAQVRPWSLMVVIADADDYIDAMLLALRA